MSTVVPLESSSGKGGRSNHWSESLSESHVVSLQLPLVLLLVWSDQTFILPQRVSTFLGEVLKGRQLM